MSRREIEGGGNKRNGRKRLVLSNPRKKDIHVQVWKIQGFKH